MCPLKKVSCKYSKRHSPWMIPEILCHIKEKIKLNVGQNTQRILMILLGIRNLRISWSLLFVRRNCHVLHHYWNNHVSHHNLLWSEINHVNGWSASHNSAVSKGVSLDNLNDFFRSIAITEDHQPADSWTLPPDSDIDKFCFSPIEVSDVVAQLQHLDVRKSTGSDGFSARFLKEVAVEIAEPLTAIYNKLLQSRVVPFVTPVHKGGDDNNPTNFCPISVVPIVAKVLEKLIANQLTAYLEDHQLLHDH